MVLVVVLSAEAGSDHSCSRSAWCFNKLVPYQGDLVCVVLRHCVVINTQLEQLLVTYHQYSIV